MNVMASLIVPWLLISSALQGRTSRSNPLVHRNPGCRHRAGRFGPLNKVAVYVEHLRRCMDELARTDSTQVVGLAPAKLRQSSLSGLISWSLELVPLRAVSTGFEP
jgi:hypothetical protein